MNIVEESSSPVVINFVVLDFLVSKLQCCLSYYAANVGLSLLLLKLNPLRNHRSKFQLALHGSVW